MKIKLYIKPNTIGLFFANQAGRDSCWTLLGDNQNCAERFGERTLRFYPAKATNHFSLSLEAETLQVVLEKPPVVVPAPVKAVEAPVMPMAPAPIAPVAMIPATPMPVAVVIEQPVAISQPPPPMIDMPQIGSVITPPPAPKPPDLRSRAGREWKAKQQQTAKA